MYPKSLLRILLSLLILLIGGYLLFTTRKIPASPQICCNDQCFTIELAQTPEERQI
ncbi:MAG: hypothetical protein LBO09_05340 [Candidatus Peribacteria bacterium]|nr:hypothetical protein [Candidatus Peribacteria bacterium]